LALWNTVDKIKTLLTITLLVIYAASRRCQHRRCQLC